MVKTEEYEGKENIILEDLENCEVLVPFVVKCLYVKNIKNCEVKMAAVSGASFIDFAVGCEIFMATHQLRIHNSTDTNFLIIARSNPIIEHCSSLGFGNLKETEFGIQDAYLGIQKDADLDGTRNLFDQVHDFNWLKQDHSPNWKVVSASEAK